ncbi:unnamed protein product [Rhizophagus irregularis]|nr:unnamed protein product [Rhizophagus irregularis]
MKVFTLIPISFSSISSSPPPIAAAAVAAAATASGTTLASLPIPIGSSIYSLLQPAVFTNIHKLITNGKRFTSFQCPPFIAALILGDNKVIIVAYSPRYSCPYY